MGETGQEERGRGKDKDRMIAQDFNAGFICESPAIPKQAG